MERADDAALDLLFREARTHSKWLEKPVPDALLRQAYELARMGPTSGNCQPLRILFVTSAEAKKKFEPCLSEGNRAKTMAAPATAIFAMDMEFYELMPRLFHDPTARSWFAGKPAAIEETAFRNSTLQAAYFMLACRSLGLDCGPMSGFDKQKTDAVFFSGTTWRSNFICNIGYGDKSALHPRNPRLDFAESCKIA
ncbi:malonic semialdehyde reductase [Dongia rigui]|uniref:Putative NADH dehydrogenase/NAD(P)H nitroreductase SMD31_08645 n=1 Tax=Dongia rigui TaxID=940149 RepID=A0ABU5DXJ7_9PROT|nr:malonic semialdehyde reductase [Dongia rigui]MDY0871989.1 malonic semialdehyde reductase [Dongia rigui]